MVDFGGRLTVITDVGGPVRRQVTAYASAGTRTVVMTITDIADDTTVVEHNVRVNSRPTARFSFSPETPNVGARVTLNAGGSTDNLEPIPNAGFDWDLDGDGQYDDADGRDHQRRLPAPPADKTVRLRVTDSDGVSDSVLHVIHVNLPPVAAFVWSPTAPVTGQTVDFTSVSRDPDGPVSAEVWDLDGDGQYDDAQGKTASITYKLAGTKTVRLRVTDAQGRTDTRAVSFYVAPAEDPDVPIIRPRPIIRVLGLAYVRDVRIDLFSVKTVPGTTVRVRCIGRGCPRRKASSTRARTKLVRLRWLERRMRTGTRIVVAITQPGHIGLHTTITLRKEKRPLRKIRCLYPDQATPTRCPKK